MILSNPTVAADSKWHQLASQVLEGTEISFAQAEEILASSNDELLDLVAAAFRLRKQYFGKNRAALFPSQCQERIVSRRLRLLFAVKNLQRADREVPNAFGRSVARRSSRVAAENVNPRLTAS